MEKHLFIRKYAGWSSKSCNLVNDNNCKVSNGKYWIGFLFFYSLYSDKASWIISHLFHEYFTSYPWFVGLLLYLCFSSCEKITENHGKFFFFVNLFCVIFLISEIEVLTSFLWASQRFLPQFLRFAANFLYRKIVQLELFHLKLFNFSSSHKMFIDNIIYIGRLFSNHSITIIINLFFFNIFGFI